MRPRPRALSPREGGSLSRRGDNSRTGGTNEADVQNLARNRRAKPSREMQRRAVAYGRLHGTGKRGVVGAAAARLYEHDPRLADDGAFPREAGANGNLIVIMRRTPAGRYPRRDAMNAGDQRPGGGVLRSRPYAESDDRHRGKAPTHLTSPHSASPCLTDSGSAGSRKTPAVPTLAWARSSL